MNYLPELIIKELAQAAMNLINLKDKMCHVLEQMKQLEEENNRLYDEHFKDKALQEAEETIRLLRSQFDKSFTISDEEYNAIEIWKNVHETDFHNGNGASGVCGGRYTYCFTPTSIGIVGIIKCVCGEEFTFSEI